ncbi:uncharacterized protein LOC143365942 isoform X2 [Andrena cerasifolii]|uniref:uncharacterized protein LOC143365942 isoform X2 n=1 Tax=Andrena cerasifolii TaxID=2819439 RepID=UPI004037706A
MSNTTRTKRTKKKDETQTGDLDTMLEIARLQEQVTLLTIENDHLRKHITENCILKPATPGSPSDVANTPATGPSKQGTTQLRNRTTKSSKVTGRGCNCKGNCSNRTCGCVKKDTQCGEFCRCNNTVCQNQEERGTEGNKENEESNERTRVEPGQLTNKPLANVTAHKSIFSPDGTLHSTPALESSRPSSIYFGSPKKLTFTLDEEEEEEDKRVKRKPVKNLNVDGVNQLDQVKRVERPRLRQNHLEVNPNHIRKLRSSSNEEKRLNDKDVDNQTSRRCTSSERSVKSDEELGKIQNRTRNHLRNIADGMAPLRRQKKENSSVKERRKNVADPDTQETSVAPVEDHATEASQDAAVQAFTSLDQERIGSPLTNNLREIGSSDDSDFNPMKPQHELTRTPAHNSSDSSSGSSSCILPLTPVLTIKMEQLPIPPELSQPEVNWDEHQSQLVACKKCKRKFHSFRISKHQACCKKL